MSRRKGRAIRVRWRHTIRSDRDLVRTRAAGVALGFFPEHLNVLFRLKAAVWSVSPAAVRQLKWRYPQVTPSDEKQLFAVLLG